jgi:hypothetical protein
MRPGVGPPLADTRPGHDHIPSSRRTARAKELVNQMVCMKGSLTAWLRDLVARKTPNPLHRGRGRCQHWARCSDWRVVTAPEGSPGGCRGGRVP